MAGINYKVTLDDSQMKKSLSGLISQVNQLSNAINNIGGPQGLKGSGSNRGLSSFIAAENFERVGNQARRLRDTLFNLSYESINVAASFEATQNQLNYAVGGMDKGSKAFEEIRKYSNHFGMDILKTADAYAKFAATTKDTNLEGDKTMKIFQGVSKAAVGLHLSTSDTNGIFYALTQMLSKGKLSAEELNRQLGNRLPGAIKLAAAAMKMSTSELLNNMKKGTIDVKKFVENFGSYLNTEFSDAAETASNSVQGQMQKMKNSFLELKQAAGEALVPVFNMVTKMMSGKSGVGGLTNYVKENAAGIAGTLSGGLAITTLLAAFGSLASTVISISAIISGPWTLAITGLITLIGVALGQQLTHKIQMEMDSIKLQKDHNKALEEEVDSVLKGNKERKGVTPERELKLLEGLESRKRAEIKSIDDSYLPYHEKNKQKLSLNKDLQDIIYQENYVRGKMATGGNKGGAIAIPGKTDTVRENVTINIHNLVEGLTISTTNLKESADDVKKIVGQLFQQAVYSAKVAGNVY
jgi:tape measure domain-containing protein